MQPAAQGTASCCQLFGMAVVLCWNREGHLVMGMWAHAATTPALVPSLCPESGVAGEGTVCLGPRLLVLHWCCVADSQQQHSFC
jgi:hypothetical protein